jgi:hypothetical protein
LANDQVRGAIPLWQFVKVLWRLPALECKPTFRASTPTEIPSFAPPEVAKSTHHSSNCLLALWNG